MDFVLRFFRYLFFTNCLPFSNISSKFLVFFANFMANERGGNDRRSMTISVTLLGVTLCVVFFAYFAFSQIYNDSDASTVEFATVVFRHGERAPTGVYPNDPHKNFTWVGGFGALTLKGSLQAYNQGIRLRKRYQRLLPLDGFYNTNQMFVMSSATERCLMTAQSFLAGFMPPAIDHHHLPIQWQPVAVNSVPRDRDRLISQKATCPKYDEMLAKMYSDPPENLKDFINSNADVFAYVSKHTGANISSIDRAEQLYNILSIEKGNGLPLPEWTEAVFPGKLLDLAERNLAVLTENDYMKRVNGGYLATDVLDQMRSNESKRKLFIYSGHDVTLVNVMRASDIIAQTSSKPDYSSALHFELHRNPNIPDDFEVKIFYSFNSEGDLQQTKIPNCDSPCSLTKFEESVQPNTIRSTDYDLACTI